MPRHTSGTNRTKQHRRRPARRPGSPTPPAGPRRRPDPLSERHRAAEPALARLHREPDLARARRPRRRPARLDPAPRPHPQPRPDVGTQAAAVPAAQHRRPARPQRPTRLAPATPRLTMDQHPARRPRPAPRPHRLTLRTTQRTGTETATDAANKHTPQTNPPYRRLTPPIHQDHERSRLGAIERPAEVGVNADGRCAEPGYTDRKRTPLHGTQPRMAETRSNGVSAMTPAPACSSSPGSA
jgi:hypothetical protein